MTAYPLAAVAAVLILSACASTQETGPVTPVVCETNAVYAEGVRGKIFPPHCAGDDALFNTYKIARNIRVLRAEYREIEDLLWDYRDPFPHLRIAHRRKDSEGKHERRPPFNWHRRWKKQQAIEYLELRQIAIEREITALRKAAGVT